MVGVDEPEVRDGQDGQHGQDGQDGQDGQHRRDGQHGQGGHGRPERAASQAGFGLLDPVAVVSLAVLVVNDHVGKAAAHGTPWSVVTGKLSDVAGVCFLPILVVAGVELVAAALRRFRGPHVGLAVVVAALVDVTFALMKTSPVVGHAFSVSLGALQWPAFAVAALAQDAPIPPVRAVLHVVDPTDLVALPAAWWVVVQTRARARSWAMSGTTKT